MLFVAVVAVVCARPVCPNNEDISPCFCFTLTDSLNIRCKNIKDLKSVISNIAKKVGTTTLHLTLDGLKESVLDDGFLQTLQVYSLSIRHSDKLSTLGDDAFRNNENVLSWLSIRETSLEKFPAKTLSKLHNLERLTIESGKIKTLTSSDTVGLPVSLYSLNLDHNLISSLDNLAFSSLKALKGLWMSGNPLGSISDVIVPSKLDFVSLQ